jgi:hypothetical protein
MSAQVGSAAAEVDRRVAKLAQAAGRAAALRRHQADPDVIALRVERVRAQVDWMLWVAVVGALAFTAVNVQAFAATVMGAAPESAAWWTAWLLDPIVSVPLIAVLRAEQTTAREQLPSPVWARRTKRLTFACTYVMNTWDAWGLVAHGHSPASLVLHSIPPVLVYFAAETGPVLRDVLTEAVNRALATAHTNTQPTTAEVTPAAMTDGPQLAGGSTSATPRPASSRRRSRTGRKRPPTPRRLVADYLAEARAALSPETDPSPAWCRQVTGCGKTASVAMAKTLRAERDRTHEPSTDDHDESEQEAA